MAFIKVESEDMRIEEAFTVKREDTEEQTDTAFIKEEREEVMIENVRVKREDAEEQTELPFIKEEREEVAIEEYFRVKREDTEEQTQMVFIGEKREEVNTEEDFRVKREDTGEQTVHEEGGFGNVQRGPAGAGVFQPYMFEPESDPECPEDDPTTPGVPRMLQPVTAWCACKNCAVMPTEKENVCCLEIPEIVRRMNQVSVTCMTHHPGFEPVCLNVYSLQNALNIYKAEYGPLRLKGKQQRCRSLARRSCVSWCWGHLSRSVRVTVPACVELRIRREFPDAADGCAGVRPALH